MAYDTYDDATQVGLAINDHATRRYACTRVSRVLFILTQRLKSAIWITVSRIVTEQTRSVPVDNSFVDALTELVFEQAVTLGGDLESFAKLDNRVVITMRDLDMVLRRNEGLKEAVYAFQG
ncbi:uncharacterized protein YALI1_B08186g [Yarrowia lipolytica]|uniref:Uncharacterized protein n=1 Tax=Yarrowia lipolytica TaxID=4952 RepID=A0A1D8N6P4_YARLL|nr:hypothetical protein YALI1_B08186g [Yarrowia lipolytica]